MNNGDDPVRDASALDAGDGGSPVGIVDAGPPDAQWSRCMSAFEYQAHAMNGHRYRVFNSTRAWNAAKDDCEADEAHLVVIGDADENQYVREMLAGASGWIGLDDIHSEGMFAWVTDEPLDYQNWAFGEPNNGGVLGGDQDCVMIKAGGTWEDQRCDNQQRFVCECEPGYTPQDHD